MSFSLTIPGTITPGVNADQIIGRAFELVENSGDTTGKFGLAIPAAADAIAAANSGQIFGGAPFTASIWGHFDPGEPSVGDEFCIQMRAVPLPVPVSEVVSDAVVAQSTPTSAAAPDVPYTDGSTGTVAGG